MYDTYLLTHKHPSLTASSQTNLMYIVFFFFFLYYVLPLA